MPLFLALASRLKWPRWTAYVLAALAVVLFAAALWTAYAIWLAAHDRRVVERDRDRTNVEVLNRTVAADRAAGAAKDDRDRGFGNEQRQIERDVEDALNNDSSPLDAVLDRLR